MKKPTGSTRWRVFKESFWGPAMWAINGLYAFFNAVLFFRDNFGSEAWKNRLTFLGLLHKLPSWAWALLVLFANIVILFEGAFRAVRKREEERNTLADKLEAIEKSRPKIRLKEPNPVIFKEVTQTALPSGRVIRVCPFLCLRFINDPELPQPSAIATRLGAKVRYFVPNENVPFLEIDGRWAGTDEPSSRHPLLTRIDLLRTDLNIGEEREVDIAFKERETGRLFAWNNENYNYSNLIKPEHELQGTQINVEVRLRGPNVDQTFAFSFASVGDGLQVVTQPQAL